MDYHGPKALLNRYFARHVGGERRPVFFDIDSTFPELTHVTRAYPRILQEFEQLLRHQQIPRYHVIDSGEYDISATTDHNWNVAMLEILGHKVEENRALCPETCRELRKVPNLMQAFFSILDPGKSIPEHEGPYLGYLRYHLALTVPTDNPPVLRVNGQPYVWKPGEAVLFDDTWPHSVENHSRELRAVLVVDVLRSMPPLASLVNRLVMNTVVRHTYGRKVANAVRVFTANETKRARAA